MTIAYSRPWDGGEKGVWTFTLTVTVLEAMAVDIEPTPDTDVSAIPAIADLVNREWALISFGGANDPQSVLEDTRITASFFKQENISGIGFRGTAGCNSYFGSFEITEEGITVGPIGATEMYCMDEGVMEQEGLFLSALGSAKGYEVSGDTLEVQYDDGTLIFTSE